MSNKKKLRLPKEKNPIYKYGANCEPICLEEIELNRRQRREWLRGRQ